LVVSQHRACEAVVPPPHQLPGQDQQEQHQDGGLADEQCDDRKGEQGHSQWRYQPRQTGDGITQEVARQQKQLEIEGEPGDLPALVSQRNEQDTGAGEPGRIVVGEELVMPQAVGCLVPTLFALKLRLEYLVVRALPGGDDLSGRPVADKVRTDLIPGRDHEEALNAGCGQHRDPNQPDAGGVDPGGPPVSFVRPPIHERLHFAL
jgi:hypothetical protein